MLAKGVLTGREDRLTNLLFLCARKRLRLLPAERVFGGRSGDGVGTADAAPSVSKVIPCHPGRSKAESRDGAAPPF